MQPYQRSSEEIKRQGELPIKALKTAGSIAGAAGSAALGGAVLSRVTPFLSKYIPQELAIQGLSKIDPRFGKFIKKALSEGTSFDEIKDFIKEKADSVDGQKKKNPQENRNIIEQYSPELHQFILDEMQNGRSPLEAGALAAMDRSGGKGFKSTIDKMVKDHKTPWSAILQTVYGGGEPGQGQQQPSNQPPQEPQPHIAEQATSGQDRLMAAIQELKKIRGG